MSQVEIPFLGVLIGTNVLVPFLGVVSAALLGLYLNFRNARDSRNRPFLEKQLELCLEACEAASKLATTKSGTIFNSTHTRFLELYWGPLSIVEDKLVAKAMIDFRKKLDALVKRNAPLPLTALETESYNLAKAARNLILRSWQIRRLKKDLEADK